MKFIKKHSVYEKQTKSLNNGSVQDLPAPDEPIKYPIDIKAQADQKVVFPYMGSDKKDKDVHNGSDLDSITKEIQDKNNAKLFVNKKLILDFGNNSNDFTKDGYHLLAELAHFMMNNPHVSVLVNGYTDDKGGNSYNVNLSEFRANNVKSYLAGKGIDTSRIKTIGHGADSPRASNTTVEGRELNRRVEIEIMNYH
jgi:outer membrane protein OmpA-like peptidoglycan-associated protein